jgi:hypothetical protein
LGVLLYDHVLHAANVTTGTISYGPHLTIEEHIKLEVNQGCSITWMVMYQPVQAAYHTEKGMAISIDNKKIIDHFRYAFVWLGKGVQNIMQRGREKGTTISVAKEDGQSSAITSQHIRLQCFMIIIVRLIYVTFKSYRLL